MGHITLERIEEELCKVMERPLTPASLELFVMLNKAKKILCEDAEHLTEEEAKDWVMHMNPPAKWTMDQTSAVMTKQGYSCDPFEFWAVMNALYSDYGKTLAKHNADKPEVWADLAYDFIHDADSKEGKIGRYYRDIVKK